MSLDSTPDWNVDLVKDTTFVTQIEVHDELSSTNDRALALAGDPDVDMPCLIIAHRQAQGRGRGGNVWWSSTGALTCSLLLELPDERLPLSRWPEMSLTVGSSVCAALSRRFPAEDVRLKWPNDVYMRGAKVCGILVEVPPAGTRVRDPSLKENAAAQGSNQSFKARQLASRVVVGIGVNVNNSAADAPDDLKQRAIALCDVGGTQAPGDVLADILQEFAQQLEDLASAPDSLRALWRRFDLLVGKTVTIDEGGGNLLTGTGLGIDDDGALLLQTEAGPRRCYAGVVHAFT